MTIRQKLIAGYATMVLIVASVGSASVFLNYRIQRDVATITDHAYAQVKTATAIGTTVQAVQIRLGQLFAARSAAQAGDPQAALEAEQSRPLLSATMADLRNRVAA